MNVLVRNRGFSLLEVMIAVAVLAIAIASVFRLYSVVMRGTVKAENYNRAVIIASSMMDEALALSDPEDAEKTEEFEDGFVAQTTVEKVFEDEETASAMYKITVTVTWPPHGEFTIRSIRSVNEEALKE